MNKRDANMQFIHDMLVKLDVRLDSVDETLIRHDENLKDHMRRTSLLEEELKPIRKHVFMIQGVGAFIGLLALIATIVAVFK
jgi:hypothetical protein